MVLRQRAGLLLGTSVTLALFAANLTKIMQNRGGQGAQGSSPSEGQFFEKKLEAGTAEAFGGRAGGAARRRRGQGRGDQGGLPAGGAGWSAAAQVGAAGRRCGSGHNNQPARPPRDNDH